MNLTHSTKLEDIDAYIITLKDHELSESLSKRCQETCKQVQMPYHVWYAVNGLGNDYIIPDHLVGKDFLSWIKLSNDKLSKSEIALFLTHVSLWEHCMTIGRPIVILEHDAKMIKKYVKHPTVNLIYYLGERSFLKSETNLKDLVPPWQFMSDTYNCIAYTHAYAIDPYMAKNLFCDAIKYGITHAVDNFIRIDNYTIIQQENFAYQEPGPTTIQRS